MRLINADAIVYDEIGEGMLAVFKHDIDDEPTVELIHCDDCEKWDSKNVQCGGKAMCKHFGRITHFEDFCSHAVKKLSHEEKTIKIMEGAKIIKAEFPNYGIKLFLNNGYVFDYYASDAGYSSWSIEKEVKNETD